MSYILKALRKSEQERQAKQPESVTDRILAPQPQKKSRKAAIWIAAILLSNLLLIGGFYWFSRSTPVPEPAKASAEAAQDQSDDSSPDMNPPSEPFVQRKQNASASIVERIAARRRQRIQAQSQAAENPDSPPVSIPPAHNNAAPAGAHEKPAVAAQPPMQTPLDEPDADEMMEEPAKVQNSGQETKIPYFDDLPYEVRQTIPKMAINAFVYAPDPAERFVVINMEKYKTGQKTKDAVELKEIRRDSLVVNFQDHTFQIGRP